MDPEAESEECDEEEGSDEESESGQASLALATTFISKSIFNLEENDNNIHTNDYADDFALTYWFMAKGSRYRMMLPPLIQVTVNLMIIKNRVIVNLLSLLLNNKLP